MTIETAKEILGDMFSFTAEDTDRVIKGLALEAGAEVLDIGTGVGNLAIALAVNGLNVVTGEPEADDSKYAKQDWLENAKKVGMDHRITFKAFDAAAMPFDDGVFHAVFCLGALHHVHEADRVLVIKESIRTARSGGPVCFFEPNPACITAIRELDPQHPDAADPGAYAASLDVDMERVEGALFDATILRHPSSK
jgi:2-polyprenyl-3-methyl-5-hydroxy-6-metoxy-1,4-benzoquinol methylase